MNSAETVRLAHEVPRANKQDAFAHRAAEIKAWVELLGSLDQTEWHRPTVCTEWDVADIAGHLCGQAEDAIKLWLFPIRDARAKRRYPDVPLIDSHMLIQADEHRGTPPAELIATFERLWNKANRTITRRPGLIRNLKVPVEGLDIPAFQKLPLGFIHDVLLARDLWMHRDDVCQAIGRPFDPGPYGQDLVAQVLLDLEFGRVWTGPAVRLELTGPAGGSWQLGEGTPVGAVRLDAVAYMRTISGRDNEPAIDLLDGDPAAVNAVAAVRMPF